MPEQLSAEQQHVKDTLQRYKNVFGTPEGKRVLGDILNLGNFGKNIHPSDSAKIAEQNFAVTIARMAGVFDPLYTELGIVRED